MLDHGSRVKRRIVSHGLLAVTLGAGAFVLAAVPGALPAGAAGCVTAGSTGLTAFEVATAAQTITTNVDATGCDIGIYVAPGNNGVHITGVTVSGANAEGILAEDVTSLSITGSTIQGNGLNPNPAIPDGHALMLDGVSNAQITGNTVQNNLNGGIGIADNGTTDPGTVNSVGADTAANNNVVATNTMTGNTGGCGIIVEAWDTLGVNGTNIHDNTVTGSVGKFTANGPDIGQIVVADDAPGASATNTIINHNTVTQSFVTGITLHANAPKDVISGTAITNNTLSQNNWGFANAAPSTDAIALIDEQFPAPNAATISGTSINGNTITQQTVAIWSKGATTTTIGTNAITLPAGGTALFTVPTAGGGYWLGGSDGGVFTFGNATYYGSAPGLGLKLQQPIVSISPSRDRGGYWELAADGGVLGFGDANFEGSLPASKVHVSNIVAMAPTPVTDQGATNGLGYWIIGSDGGVFAMGDAGYFGSVPGLGVHVNNIVGIVPTSDGLGYYLVGSDGGVYAFGDAVFHGSVPGLGAHVNDVVGIAATSTGKGYWLVGSDGGVFAFGDATYKGSVPGDGAHINNVVGITSTPDDGGYTLAGNDGGIFTFGDAMFDGSVPGLGAHIHNVVGLAST